MNFKDKDIRNRSKYDIILILNRANRIKPWLEKRFPALKGKKKITLKDLDKMGKMIT